MAKSNGTSRRSSSSSPRGLNQGSSVPASYRPTNYTFRGEPVYRNEDNLYVNASGQFIMRRDLVRNTASTPTTQREIAPLVRLTEDAEQATEYGGRTDSIYASYGGYQMQGSRNSDGTITPVSAYTTENGNHFDSDLHGRLTEAGFRDYAALYFAEWAREDARGSRRRR